MSGGGALRATVPVSRAAQPTVLCSLSWADDVSNGKTRAAKDLNGKTGLNGK